MKYKIFSLSLLFLIGLSACNRGSRDWDHFKEKFGREGTTIQLNGLMKLALSGMVAKEMNDPESQAVIHILKKMKGIEINIIPKSQAHYTTSEVEQLSYRLNHSHYESLINIQKGNMLINLWARGKENEFSDPFALINFDNDVIMVEMKGTLDAKDIQTIVNAGKKYSGSGDASLNE